jgi:two-component system sensor histidine kinase CreC
MQEEMPPEKRARFLTNIQSEANRIQQIIDRMLKLSELETRKGLDKIERISLLNILQTVIESKSPIISRGQLTVKLHRQNDAVIKGDSFLLHQAVSNLIQNAIDFSPPYGQIELTLEKTKDTIVFQVADSGPGIPEFALGKVFDKFFSLQRPVSGKKSTGLGLNFTREVALLHRGGVTLQNRSGNGALATMTLPII